MSNLCIVSMRKTHWLGQWDIYKYFWWLFGGRRSFTSAIEGPNPDGHFDLISCHIEDQLVLLLVVGIGGAIQVHNDTKATLLLLLLPVRWIGFDFYTSREWRLPNYNHNPRGPLYSVRLTFLLRRALVLVFFVTQLSSTEEGLFVTRNASRHICVLRNDDGSLRRPPSMRRHGNGFQFGWDFPWISCWNGGKKCTDDRTNTRTNR